MNDYSPIAKKSFEQKISSANKELAAAFAVFNKYAPVLSSSMSDRIATFIGVSSHLLEAFDHHPATGTNTNTMDAAKYRGVYLEIIQTARKELGTEGLTHETLELISKLTSESPKDGKNPSPANSQ
jgi:hypothetical protein